MLNLPADVWFLVCEELSKRSDFGSLFNCALVDRSLAECALLWLYRIYYLSSIISSEGSDENSPDESYESRRAGRLKTTALWALQWKSIIRSSLGRTARPYCLYIRTLDLRSLQDLLDDPLFREAAHDSFFAGDMEPFLSAHETPMKQKVRGAKKRAYKRLDIVGILKLIGDSITEFVSEAAKRNKATVAVEELTGDVDTDSLLTWTGRLSNLKSLTLWNGSILNRRLGSAIAKSCFHFDDLTFKFCDNFNSDRNLAAFIEALNPNSLRSFVALSAMAVGTETLLSLNHHSKSLKKLNLDGLRTDAMRNISLLQGCENLQTLEIADSEGIVNLETTENDVFLELIAWLCRCRSLRELTFKNVVCGPKVLTQVCLHNDIRLRELQVYGYSLTSNQDFHRALTNQADLESLTLMADADPVRDDIDILVSSIVQLKSLTFLKLLSISDYFHTPEILALAHNLKNLRELHFSGYDVTDDIWHVMSGLHDLTNLNIQALSSFTFDGIMSFISALHDTNQGLQLSVANQITEKALTEEQQLLIREAIATKVGGKFDFTLFQDDDDSDLSLFSD